MDPTASVPLKSKFADRESLKRGRKAQYPTRFSRLAGYAVFPIISGRRIKMEGKETQVQVWFDSQCPLCAKEIAFMKRLDWFKRVEFVDIYTTADCPLDPRQLLARFHAREKGQPIVDGAAAFAALWRHLPLLKPLGVVARIPLVLRMLEKAYVQFLRVRPALQRFFGT